MAEKKQLNVRIPLKLQEKIDNDGRPKVDIVVDALNLYFDSKEHLKASRNGNSVNSNTSENNITTDSNDDTNILISINASNNASSPNINDSNNASSPNINASNNDISSNIDDINSDSSISKTDPIHINEIAGMKNEIEFLRSKLDDLIKLLHQEQVLHIQTQRMLMAPEKPPVTKKWWQLWK